MQSISVVPVSFSCKCLDQTPWSFAELSPTVILVIAQFEHRLRPITLVHTRTRLAALLPDVAALPHMPIRPRSRRVGLIRFARVERMLPALGIAVRAGGVGVQRLVQRAKLLTPARTKVQEVGKVDEECGAEEVGEDVAPLELFPLRVR